MNRYCTLIYYVTFLSSYGEIGERALRYDVGMNVSRRLIHFLTLNFRIMASASLVLSLRILPTMVHYLLTSSEFGEEREMWYDGKHSSQAQGLLLLVKRSLRGLL